MAHKDNNKNGEKWLDKADALKLETFQNSLTIFRDLNGEFPLQYIIALIEISRHEGLSLTDLSKKTNLTLSTLSRIVGALSDYRANGEPYHLVDLRVSATSRRTKEIFLTDKGKTLITTLLEKLS